MYVQWEWRKNLSANSSRWKTSEKWGIAKPTKYETGARSNWPGVPSAMWWPSTSLSHSEEGPWHRYYAEEFEKNVPRGIWGTLGNTARSRWRRGLIWALRRTTTELGDIPVFPKGNRKGFEKITAATVWWQPISANTLEDNHQRLTQGQYGKPKCQTANVMGPLRRRDHGSTHRLLSEVRLRCWFV